MSTADNKDGSNSTIFSAASASLLIDIFICTEANTHFIIYLSFFISFSLSYAIIKTILKHTPVHFACRKNQSLFSQNDPTLVQAGRVLFSASADRHQMAAGVPQSLFSWFSEHEKNKIHGRFFDATFKMATLVAFLAANIGNYPLLMINYVYFLNGRFSSLECCRKLKIALN